MHVPSACCPHLILVPMLHQVCHMYLPICMYVRVYVSMCVRFVCVCVCVCLYLLEYVHGGQRMP